MPETEAEGVSPDDKTVPSEDKISDEEATPAQVEATTEAAEAEGHAEGTAEGTGEATDGGHGRRGRTRARTGARAGRPHVAGVGGRAARRAC